MLYEGSIEDVIRLFEGPAARTAAAAEVPALV